MNLQKRLSPRVRAVVDALNHVQEIRREWTDDEPLDFTLFQHKETEEVCVIIPQGDDPEDSLMLDDNGLKGMQEGSMYLPWDEHQGEAFFAAVITAFMCHKLKLHEKILQPPACEQCEEAQRFKTDLYINPKKIDAQPGVFRLRKAEDKRSLAEKVDKEYNDWLAQCVDWIISTDS